MSKQQITSPPTNSPVKSATPRSVPEDTGTFLAEKIRERVRSELNNSQMTANAKEFLDKILPISSDKLQMIFKHLTTQGFYQPNKTWKEMPTQSPHPSEVSIYEPLVNIANAINNFAKSRNWVGEDQIKGQWVNCSSTVPLTTEEIRSKIRPDLAFVSVQTDESILDMWRNDTQKAMTRSRSNELKGEMAADLKAIWWLQMLSLLEVKKDVNDTEDALEQLCCYVREIFRHQADRRFVIGLTLCANSLRAYLFDRSGVLGMNRDIDINKEPLMFIQILAAFSVLHSEDMGWDSTMTLFDRDLPVPVPSFSYPWKKLRDNGNTNFKPQWVIKLKGVFYVTLLDVDTLDAQVMCGRATLVWEVCELSKFRTRIRDGAEILVLKQSWQRLPGQADKISELKTIPLEEYCYMKAGIAEDGLKEAGYVLDRNGNIVSTANSIRKKLKVEREPLRDRKTIIETSTRSSKSRSSVDTNARQGASSKMSDGDRKTQNWQLEKDRAFADRRLTRVLMKWRGHRLSRFKSLDELLLAFRNTVKRHKKLYDAGILHRDISPNNIIILHHSLQTDDKVAELLDYDHVKIAEDFKSWRDMRPDQQPIDHTAVRKAQLYLFGDKSLSLAAVRSCLEISNNSVQYLVDMFDRFPSRYPTNKPGKEMELEDLGLEEPDPSLPYFSAEAGLGQRTGTPAYISHQIIKRNSKVVHNAIHDMESLFWILIEYVLIYKGPAGSEAELTFEAKNSLENYLESGSDAHKSDLFLSAKFSKASKTLNEELVKHIQKYFEPLKTLVEECWKTLYTAYQHEGFELVNIHSHMDAIVQKTLEDVRAMNLPVHEYTIREERRREKLDQAMENAFTEQRMIVEEDMADNELTLDSLHIGDDVQDVFGGPSRT